MLNENQAVNALGALAQETRLKIVRFLIQQGPTGSAAGTISRNLNVSASRLSFHLAALEHAGILTSKRVSRNIFYRANYDRLGNLIAYLLEDCCGNNPTILACCSTKDKS